jgi:hypothetical protein
MWVVYLAEACLRAGRPDEAAVHARRAHDLARARAERGFAAWAAWALGESAAHGGEREAAAAAYRAALADARALGMRPLAARCAAGLERLGLDGTASPPDAGAHR